MWQTNINFVSCPFCAHASDRITLAKGTRRQRPPPAHVLNAPKIWAKKTINAHATANSVVCAFIHRTFFRIYLVRLFVHCLFHRHRHHHLLHSRGCRRRRLLSTALSWMRAYIITIQLTLGTGSHFCDCLLCSSSDSSWASVRHTCAFQNG